MRQLSLAIALVVALAAPGFAQTKAVPTWNQDVGPIMARHCVPCHAPGGSASVKLMTYEAARPLAGSIMGRVWSRSMPPWYADPDYGRGFNYTSKMRLSDEDVRTIIAWATGGAPQGEPLTSAATPASDPVGVWTLKVGTTGRSVVLVVARQQSRLTARMGPSEKDSSAADNFAFENQTMVARHGGVTYTLKVDGATATGTAAGSGDTDAVTGTKQATR